MTLKLTPEEKAERRKQYKHEYSRVYYQEQKAENNERYQDILNKAKARYETKKGGNVRAYKKRNIAIENEEE